MHLQFSSAICIFQRLGIFSERTVYPSSSGNCTFHTQRPTEDIPGWRPSLRTSSVSRSALEKQIPFKGAGTERGGKLGLRTPLWPGLPYRNPSRVTKANMVYPALSTVADWCPQKLTTPGGSQKGACFQVVLKALESCIILGWGPGELGPHRGSDSSRAKGLCFLGCPWAGGPCICC